jgi:two-component system chemotaxis response regulator CheB
MTEKIRVLIVDDSLFFREKIKIELSRDKNIEVVGTAEDAFDARDKIISLNPHVLVLDIEMPKIDGISFLKLLLPQYPIPVVAISSESSYVFEAMKAGAVDFVCKTRAEDEDKDVFFRELIAKVKIASIAKVGNQVGKREHGKEQYTDTAVKDTDKIIAIGASTGGTEAIFKIIKALPKTAPAILVVQHMPPVFTRMFANRLNDSCAMRVTEAKNDEPVYPGTVLVAPGDYHMRLVKKNDSYCVECSKGEKVNGHCPSVDVLFNSIAELNHKNAVGVILTGMGRDGAQGLLNMKKNGNITIGQDESTSVVYGMPREAYELGAVRYRVPLDNIPEMLLK